MKNNRWVRYTLIIAAIFIFVVSLFISNSLVSDLETHVKDLETHVKALETHVKDLEQLVEDRKQEELKKMELWVEAMRSINSADENTDLNLALEVLESNNTIPVVIVDKNGAINTYRNVDLQVGCDTVAVLNGLVERAAKKGYMISMDMPSDEGFMKVYYDDSLVLSRLSELLAAQSVLLDSQSVLLDSQSSLLSRLSYYPHVQLTVLLLFFIISIAAIISSKRAEQNRVWVGLSKETAHQLGTPISSLMAWSEVLRDKYPDDELLHEMGKDVNRLQTVAERFSKIGSKPEPTNEDVVAVADRVVDYMRRRTSNKVNFEVRYPSRPIMAMINAPLFEWVMENLCKNAIDAMDGEGVISIYIDSNEQKTFIEVSDTGKGMPRSYYKRVFEPGFTTKKRGWGLGLSLAKRIMEQYHRGRIFVKASEVGKGTTFRLELKK